MNDFGELKGHFDTKSGFVLGHQINSIRRSKRATPIWASNNQEMGKLLKIVFPKLHTDPKQRYAAGRWARVIQLHFRSLRSRKETADEMGEKPATIKSLIRSIKRAALGRAPSGQIRKKRTKFMPPTEQ